MLLCKQCRKTIANASNPTVHYSTCIDCGKKHEESEIIYDLNSQKEMVDVISTDLNGKETKEKWDYKEFYDGDIRLYEAERILRQHTENTNPAYYNKLIKQHFNKWRNK